MKENHKTKGAVKRTRKFYRGELSKFRNTINCDNSYTTSWDIPGEKKESRFSVFEVAFYILIKEFNINFNRLEITGINVSEDAEKISVTVKLGRPGILIGKMGTVVDKLSKEMTDEFGKKTEIIIQEDKERLIGVRSTQNY